MATVGQRLTVPEAGWKRYDENHPAFVFNGVWGWSGSAQTSYNADALVTNVAGDYVKFHFIGTKLRIVTRATSNQSNNIAISIDGIEKTISLQIANDNQILVYEELGLDDKRHEVIVKNNTGGLWFEWDSIDIDDSGRLLHPDEVLVANELEVGKRIRCHYQASSGKVGVFGGLGKETSDFIPPASSASPDGDFYFIMFKDWNGVKRLAADRNIQHSISWDTLNSAGIASGSGVPVMFEMANSLPDYNYTASSVFVSGSSGEWSAWKAFKPNPEVASGWQSTGLTNEWVQVDLGEPKMIDSVLYTPRAETTRNVKDFEILVSNDGQNWKSVYTGTASNGQPEKYPLNTEEPYRYLRFFCFNAYNSTDRIVVEHLNVFVKELNATARLLTGGTSWSDKDNEWDRYIVGSNLDGTIVEGDNSVWNWNVGIYSTTSTTTTSNPIYRAGRGYSSGGVSAYRNTPTITSGTPSSYGFRPVLEIDILTSPISKYLVNDNGEIKVWGSVGEGESSLVPKLTAMDSDPVIRITHSDTWSTPGYEGFRAFDKGNATSERWQTKSATGWLQVDFGAGNKKSVIKYTIQNTTIAMYERMPRDWTLQGSDDGTTWKILDTVTAQGSWGDSEKREFIVDNPGAYRYYKVDITANNNMSTAALTIPELDLIGGSEISGWKTLGDAPATEEMFLDSGMNELDLIPVSAWYQLSSPIFEILGYVPEILETHETRNINIDYKDGTTIDDKLYVTANPIGQVIQQEQDYAVESPIESFTLTASVPANNELRIVFSTNSGTTWNSFDGNLASVDISNPNDVKIKGLTPDEFNAVEWKVLVQDKIRFAYYLEQNTTEDDLHVASIEISFVPLATETPTLDKIQLTYNALTIEGRLKDLERINAINMAKLQFKSNVLMQSDKYKLHDLVVDTMESDEMIVVDSSPTSDTTVEKTFGVSVSHEGGYITEVSLSEFKNLKKVEVS